MSDIPDWLVELAAQGGTDEEEEEAPVDTASEAVPLDDADTFVFASEPETVAEPMEVDLSAEEAETPEDLMDALRSQVEADAVEEEAVLAEGPSRSFSLRLPGLLPWQQLVLTVLFFLDVVVIGLLILVMLGRISIP